LSQACKCSDYGEVRSLIIILLTSITVMHLRPAAWPIAGASIVLLIVGAVNSSTFINVTNRVHSSAKRQIKSPCPTSLSKHTLATHCHFDTQVPVSLVPIDTLSYCSGIKKLLELQNPLQGKKILLNSSVCPHRAMMSHPVSVSASASSGADSIGYRAPHRYRPNPSHNTVHDQAFERYENQSPNTMAVSVDSLCSISRRDVIYHSFRSRLLKSDIIQALQSLELIFVCNDCLQLDFF
jgi:hypothetical protein